MPAAACSGAGGRAASPVAGPDDRGDAGGCGRLELGGRLRGGDDADRDAEAGTTMRQGHERPAPPVARRGPAHHSFIEGVEQGSVPQRPIGPHDLGQRAAVFRERSLQVLHPLACLQLEVAADHLARLGIDGADGGDIDHAAGVDRASLADLGRRAGGGVGCPGMPSEPCPWWPCGWVVRWMPYSSGGSSTRSWNMGMNVGRIPWAWPILDLVVHLAGLLEDEDLPGSGCRRPPAVDLGDADDLASSHRAGARCGR